jgi:N utilization substance protein A
VVVSEDQLSLAIGKKGQNVRLAARLTGWKIDIKSEAEKVREVERQMEHLERSKALVLELPGVGAATLEKLTEAGYDTLEAVAQTETEVLAEVPGLGPASAEKLRDGAADILQQLIEEEGVHYAAEDQARREAEDAARLAAIAGEDALDEALGVAQFLGGSGDAAEEAAAEGGEQPEVTLPDAGDAVATAAAEEPAPESDAPAPAAAETEPAAEEAAPKATENERQP